MNANVSSWVAFWILSNSGHHSDQTAQQFNMSDLDTDFVEIQVGGGRPDATVPPVLTPTCLCTSIKATDHDGSVMHQTHLVQWTWSILLIWDYPGASDECDPCSSHPSYKNPLRWRRIPEEMAILERVMTAWCLVDITPPRTSQEAEETKEKWKRKAQITFLVPSVKFRHPMPAFWLFEYLICFLELSSMWLYHHKA